MSNKFCWNELLSHDVEKHKNFYCKLFGWEAVAKPEHNGYIVFKKDGNDLAGLMQMPEGHENVPSNWFSYISVDDVDATVAKAKELGGEVHVEPMDIPNVGRIAIIMDSAKAMIGLCQCQCQEKKCCCKKKIILE